MREEALRRLKDRFWDVPCEECGCGASEHMVTYGPQGEFFAMCLHPTTSDEQYVANVRAFQNEEHEQVGDENFIGSHPRWKCHHSGYGCHKAQCPVSVSFYGTIPDYGQDGSVCQALYREGDDWLCAHADDPQCASELHIGAGCCSTMISWRMKKILRSETK